jgi:hypothetical protein
VLFCDELCMDSNLTLVNIGSKNGFLFGVRLLNKAGSVFGGYCWQMSSGTFYK